MGKLNLLHGNFSSRKLDTNKKKATTETRGSAHKRCYRQPKGIDRGSTQVCSDTIVDFDVVVRGQDRIARMMPGRG